MTSVTNSSAFMAGMPKFTKDLDQREVYAKAVEGKLGNLQQLSLVDVKEFHNKVIADVGQKRLTKAEDEVHRAPIRYFIWAKDHPRLDLFFRIITFGIIHKVAITGKTRYDKHHAILDIARSVEIIEKVEKTKGEEVSKLQNKVLANFDTTKYRFFEVFSPAKGLELLTELQKKNGKLDGFYIGRVRAFLEKSFRYFLENSNTFTNDNYYNALVNIYSLIGLKNNALATLEEVKEVYNRSNLWVDLPFEDKLELLQIMQQNPERYKPILQELVIDTEKLLSWENFNAHADEERQQIITMVSIIRDIPDLEGSELLSEALTALREHVRSTCFKECDWNNEEAELHLEEICHNLDLVDEFAIAEETALIEADWENTSFDDRLDNTELLVNDSNHYGKELERRRAELFATLEGLINRSSEEYEYAVEMLHILQPVFKKGCDEKLQTATVAVLDAIKKGEGVKEDLLLKARIIGIDAKVLNGLAPEGWLSSAWNYLYTGKSKEERDRETLSADLLHRRHKMREIGIPTEIDHMPKAEDLPKFQIADSHLKVGPPSIPSLSSKANVTELMGFLREADKAGVIPLELTESTSDTSSYKYSKAKVLEGLNNLFNKLSYGGLNDRLTRVRDVLAAYTDQVKMRLREARNPQEKRDIYNELVELICKEVGFSCFHCEDRKVNAAMQIYNEKLATKPEESGSPKQKVLGWLALKRDALVSNMLQEMVQYNITHSILPVFYDVSSSISRWRYVMRRQLGLGDVPSPAYSIDSGLSERQILDKFRETYTPEWILEQAMEEHTKPDGNSALKISAISDYLDARIKNFDRIKEELLHEETYALLKEGMALYLQEIGVFNPIV